MFLLPDVFSYLADFYVIFSVFLRTVPLEKNTLFGEKILMRKFILTMLTATIALIIAVGCKKEIPDNSPNGIAYPVGFKDWKIIGLSHREDNKTMRYILGNDIAVKAAREGKTNPWPEGSILGKIVWNQKENDRWPAALGPDKLVHSEFMVKDSKKYASTGGWGFARWLGMDQKPYTKPAGKEEKFAGSECMACHMPVKGNDYVFTKPVELPGSQDGVKAVSTGISIPVNYKDMRVLSVARRMDNKTMRYILGNDIAIEAARSGKTNPWPVGTILAKLVWKEGKHDKWPTAIVPEKFVHAEFMLKNAEKYSSTGGWGYARWLGKDQKPYEKPFGSEEKYSGNECMSCHTPVKDRDYVFTHSANMP
jgi:hypothetical protein